MGDDGARDDRRRRVATIGLHVGRHTVAGQDLKCRLLRRAGQGMGIHAEKQRAAETSPGAIVDDGLGDGENMRFIETAIHGTAAMAARAERNTLSRVADVRLLAVGRQQLRDVGEAGGGSRLSGEWVNHRYVLLAQKYDRSLPPWQRVSHFALECGSFQPYPTLC